MFKYAFKCYILKLRHLFIYFQVKFAELIVVLNHQQFSFVPRQEGLRGDVYKHDHACLLHYASLF